ncbi:MULTISPECIES: hypothetical protein [unclassified Enterococcus]|uniref:hypothetical protein n=1 Tax=unclassified Enterococcus TaxID=2608891 RepID=UPI001A90DC0A|nr:MULTISPECIES: hypothetical protein [unclassified Enterococcus]MBO0460820.1 hypothetical protein [Enterococcus sp. DIV1298c]MBO1299927.1 hypothetical protein [Enterococcus sp. DIV1271a]
MNIITQETPTAIEKNEQKKKKRLLVLVLLLLALVAIGWYWYTNNQPTQILSDGFPEIKNAEKMTGEQLKKYANQAVDESNVTINVYPEVNINADGKTGNIWIQNLPTNRYGQQAILSVKDSQEKLYETGLLEPGYEVTELTLTKNLSSGEYPGVVELEFYDLDNKKLMGKTTVDVMIHVNE